MAERSEIVDGPVPAPARRRPPFVAQLDLTSFGAFVAGLLAALALIAIFRSSPSTITKVSVGIIIALALDPVITRFQHRFKWTRVRAVVVIALGLTIVFAGVIVVLGPPAVREARSFTADIPSTVEDFYDFPIIGPRLERADASQKVSDWIDKLPTRIDDDTIASAAETILGGVVTMLLVLITAIAVMLDGEAIVARARRLLPPSRRERADRAGRIIYRSIGRYFAGSLFIAVLNGLVILSVGLALGIPLAPLAAIWSMITNLIPQIGGFLGGSFFVLLALSQSPLAGAIALVVFLVYQQIENNILQPAIVGKAVNLSPPTTMLAALIGGAAAGVPGALAATPLVGAAKALFMTFRQGARYDVDEPEERLNTRLKRIVARITHRGKGDDGKGEGEGPEEEPISPDRIPTPLPQP
jgi:predicted PurR-regulated permease PerM